MVSLFISHSSRDRAVAERVADHLRSEGFASLFLDFDPEQGIPAGRDWQHEIQSQLLKTDTVVFLASEASIASHWCFAELAMARFLQRPILPVRLGDTARPSFLGDLQWVDLSAGESALGRIVRGLQQSKAEAFGSFPWDPQRVPYPGLEPFAADDAAVFFGREDEIDRLLERLQPLARFPGRFVAIAGPSGSGKSSLLHAGILPRLRRQGHLWEVLPPFTPEQEPTRNLARSLKDAFAARGETVPLATVESTLREGPAGLVRLARDLARSDGAGNTRARHVLVVVDQAEELLTRTGPAEQHSFLRLLADALDVESPLWVLATVGSEFLTTSPERAGLIEVIDDPLLIESLSRARLPEIIERPAHRGGVDFAPGLVGRIVEETTGGDALSLLAYTLRQLYDRRGGVGTVTFADYESIGGVVGALRRSADALRDRLTRRGRGEAVLPTLLKLAAVEGDQESTRRRVPYGALSQSEQEVVDAFVEDRLLVRRGGLGGETLVEVAHESLLRQWAPLRDAIETSRESLRLRSDLERLAADWDHGQQDESYLLRGGRLAVFET